MWLFPSQSSIISVTFIFSSSTMSILKLICSFRSPIFPWILARSTFFMKSDRLSTAAHLFFCILSLLMILRTISIFDFDLINTCGLCSNFMLSTAFRLAMRDVSDRAFLRSKVTICFLFMKENPLTIKLQSLKLKKNRVDPTTGPFFTEVSVISFWVGFSESA